MTPIPSYTPSGGGPAPKDASEIASAINSSYISVSSPIDICDSSRDWSMVMPGGAFASFDDANNQLKALQGGRYRFEASISWDYKSDVQGDQVEVGIQPRKGSAPPFATAIVSTKTDPDTSTYSKCHTVISRIIDMQADEAINIHAFANASTGSAQALIEPDQGVGMTYMQLEYLGPTP